MTERTLEEFLAFVRQFEAEAPLEGGVRHLILRNLLGKLGIADLIEWLASGEFEMAEEEFALRFHNVRPFIEQLDTLLATPAPTAEDVIVIAIADRLSTQLDRIITASVARLPADLHTRSTRSRVIRRNVATPIADWQRAREALLSTRRAIELAVADLARAYARREEMENARIAGEQAIAQARSCVQQLQDAEHTHRALEQQLRALHEETLPFLDHAKRVISQMTRLRAALSTLEVLVPAAIDEQMREWEEKLQAQLANMRDDFVDLPLLERDAVLAQAIVEVDELDARVRQILNPIRPSVFVRPLDRPEELRRLALLALYIYTTRAEGTASRGIGKRTAPELLVRADLIDPSELDAAAEAIKLSHESAGGKLSEIHKRGKMWFYTMTLEGADQVQQWLLETLDQEDLFTKIVHAITKRRADKREERKQKTS